MTNKLFVFLLAAMVMMACFIPVTQAGGSSGGDGSGGHGGNSRADGCSDFITPKRCSLIGLFADDVLCACVLPTKPVGCSEVITPENCSLIGLFADNVLCACVLPE